MKKVLSSPFLWFGVSLVLLELAAGAALPYSLQSTAAELYRNPTDHRGWPEYLGQSTAAKDDRPLVVLITNSQGVGKEIDDPTLIYPAIVKDRLAAENRSFENWASGGIRTVDLDLLSAKAVERGADLVVMALMYRNFDLSDQLNLHYPFSDIKLLAGEPHQWRFLRDMCFGPSLKFEDVVSLTAKRHISLARLKTAVDDTVAGITPTRWHKWLIGRVTRPRPRLDRMKDEALSPFWTDQKSALEEWKKIEDKRRRRGLLTANREEIDNRLAAFDSFFGAARKRLANHGIKMAWVWIPVNHTTMDRRGLAEVSRFMTTATDSVSGAGIRVYDLSNLISPEHFVTPGHFDVEGHAILAEEILKVVSNEL